MSTLKTIARNLLPSLLVQISDTRKTFRSTSDRPWRDAFSYDKRVALIRSRFSILPEAFKRSPKFVIDVGANEGQWIGSLLDLLTIPEVWIFEPNPAAMAACRQRVGNRSGVRYFDAAVGEAAGQIELHITGSSDHASVLQPRAEFIGKHYSADAADVARTIQVPLCTLDSIVPESQSIDLLKIDVQGFERAVLAGAQRVLVNTRAVLIEANLQSHYVGDELFPALWNQLAAAGFSLWSLSPPYLGAGGQALWADAVFVRNASI